MQNDVTMKDLRELFNWGLFTGFLCLVWKKCFRGKDRKRERFLGGQIDMQESKKDKQMGIKYPILFYLRLQQDCWSIIDVF